MRRSPSDTQRVLLCFRRTSIEFDFLLDGRDALTFLIINFSLPKVFFSFLRVMLRTNYHLVVVILSKQISDPSHGFRENKFIVADRNFLQTFSDIKGNLKYSTFIEEENNFILSN